MSQQAMTTFISALPENPDLAGRLRHAVEQSEGQQTIEAVARVATEAGYDVDIADVMAFRARTLELLEDGDLSEENLEQVAGGLVGVDDVLIAGVGVAILGGIAASVGLSATAGATGMLIVGGFVSQDFGDKAVTFLTKW